MVKKKKRERSHLRTCSSLRAHGDHSGRCNSLHDGLMNYHRAFNSHCEGVYTLYLQPDSDTTEDSLKSYSCWYGG